MNYIAVLGKGDSNEESAFQEIYMHNFKKPLSKIPCFYCRGAWNEEVLTFKDRTLFKMLRKAMTSKASDTFEPWQKALITATEQKTN